MVDYWLDSSVLIEGRKGPYDFDLAPRFWTVLDERAEDGLLAFPNRVYRELLGKPDDLADWARGRIKFGMFVDSDASVQDEIQNIRRYVLENYPKNQSRRRFLGKADPWIIAYAIATGGAVVTQEEGVSDASAQVRIPNVCGRFGVRCITVYRMLLELGVSWTV